MRVTLIHILLTTFSVAFVYAVDTMGQKVLEKKITLDVDGEDFQQALIRISEQAKVKFAYSPELVEDQKRVTLHMKNASLEEVLAELLGPEVHYKVIGKRIVLSPVNQLEEEQSEEEKLEASVAVTVAGKVSDGAGNALPGVSILVKGTSTGTSTDTEGKYVISVSNPEDVLIFSFIGFSTQEIPVGNRTTIDVVLVEDATQLNEVVVTALGIERETKSLTYSVQQVGGEQLTVARDANLMNTLNGKVAGITINRANGVGGSTRVVLRGNKSTIANQALYVIDGVPMQNPSIGQPTDVWGQSAGSGSSGRDAGDAISNINPDDIESISILKGASAAALYGSQAANGVILITTKKGKAGQSKIDFSSNFTMENVLVKPELQFKYGQTDPVSNTRDSWGNVVNAPDHVSDFWKTGTTWTNSLSFSGGTEKAQTYVSYSNTTNNGILPTSEFDRHTLNLRETAKLLDDRLSIDASVNLLTQKSHNRPVSGIYNNPLTGLYLMPRGLDFNNFKDNYQYFSPTRNMYLQNWWNINFDKGMTGEDDQQNPYWALYKNTRDDRRDRVFGSLTLNYKLADWLHVQARGRYDKSFDKYELKSYAGTQGVFAAPNGRYTLDEQFNTQLYGDFLLLANKKLSEQWMLSATLGTSIQDIKANDDIMIDASPTDPKGLNIPNVFSVWNISPTAERVTQTLNRKQLQGVFASAQLGFKDYLFFDLTARNDWSSAFAYTSTMKSGYFYYSGGVNAVLTEMVSLPQFISFAKVRASYAKVGNDVPAYITHPRDYAVNGTRNSVDQNLLGPNPYKELKPEDNRSFEVGTELKFFDNRVGIDFTYYINNNYDQFITSPASAGASTNYSTWYWNLGNIRNKGVEISATVVPVKNSTLNWTSTLNFAANRNKVLDMTDNAYGLGADNWQVLSDFGVNMYGLFIRQGGSWGDIYGNRKLVRDDQGRVVVDATGTPVTESTPVPNATYAGNPQAKFTLGWNNTIDFSNNISVSFLIDGRFGGKVISLTQAYLDFYGYSKASADARDNGGVDVAAAYEDGTAYEQKIDAQKYYTAIGGRAGVASEYAYSATNVRLREFSVGYKLPVQIKGIRNISLSLIGRNLFFISRKAPFDPEITMSTANNLQGIDVFGLPTTRSYGVNLKVGF
ncbi:MAG TPA: SusC/RagA family TonB-linked outer membrane protein [Ohtaekwangia sp.]|uniref:SusC/RagA family TonB-linked outer membrane protein n=1 Tax=Ohtaekwangia sp. TaxID=2066019 RepID=UPI002F92DE39